MWRETLNSKQTLANKVVVITGSTRGIGLGLARAFLQMNWSVMLTARHHEQLQAVISDLSSEFAHNRVHGHVCDVTQVQDLTQLWQEAQAYFGHIDVWINNAGTCNAAKALLEIDNNELKQVIETNVLGCMLGSKVALQGMLKQGFGQIFNMEGWGSRGEWSAGMTAYSTSKRAVAYFTRALYKETRHTAIKVGALSPGMVATDLLIDSWQQGEVKNWRKMKWLFMFVIDPPEPVCRYLAKGMSQNNKNYARIVWMTPWRLALRFLQPYYWRRNPVKNTVLDEL
ncbi:SDR family oxidoreductase [Acinetobacter rudis]|uniref:SDR family NAD(P)-dependent oxidoreductase n=1 Tax=Acinetobacter rudis TaxID=632955 RepID=UPI00280D0CB7|nr:SDR family oxidoreductase [Acinetobacter rudis]MDQ8951679.1 SDR family oxidoreductase [Acinetobacter rudis]